PCIKAGQYLIVENPYRSFIHFANSVIISLDYQTTIFSNCSADTCYGVLGEGDLDPERSVDAIAPPLLHYFGRVVQLIECRPDLIENCPQDGSKVLSASGH